MKNPTRWLGLLLAWNIVAGAVMASPHLCLTISTGVKSIGQDSFQDCGALMSLTIPDTVTDIAPKAFSGCNGLKTLSVPVAWERLGLLANVDIQPGCEVVYREDSKTRWQYGVAGNMATITGVETEETELVTPSELGGYPVTAIGDKVFFNRSNLTSVVIGNGVTNIGYRAFYGCSGLEAMSIPDSVMNIGSSAFDKCSNLRWLSIPQYVCSTRLIGFFSSSTNLATVEIRTGVTNIAPSAFSGCGHLTSVAIPDSVTSIGKRAFNGCVRLESIKIPTGVTNIDEETFYGCHSLASVLLPDGLENIGKKAFYSCISLESVFIPVSVTNVGNQAFTFCRGMESFQVDEDNQFYASRDGILFSKDLQTLLQYPIARQGAYTSPDHVKVIGINSFVGCTGLTSVVIGDSVKTIEAAAFYECNNLMNVAIGHSVEKIDNRPFDSCNALQAIDVSVDNESYTSVDGVLFDKNKESLVWYPSGKSGSAYSIPGSVTNIGNQAFSGCMNLTAIIIPDSVQSLRYGAFWGCSNLASVVIGSGVTRLDWFVFRGCSALTSLSLPDSVTQVGLQAFRDCNALETLSVPGEWEGTDMLASAYVPEGCEIVYRPCLETKDTPVPVPYGWLKESCAIILAANGGDYEATATAVAANGLPVWKCYVAGLSTTNENAVFQIKSIAITNGEVQVEWAPDLNENGTKTNRSYRVEGKPTLTNDWTFPAAPDSRFFRVWVGMPEQ